VIGILTLKDQPRFITNTQQLDELVMDIRNRKLQTNCTLIIDAKLQADARTKESGMVTYLMMAHRKIDAGIILIASQNTKIAQNTGLLQTDILKLTAQSIVAHFQRG